MSEFIDRNSRIYNLILFELPEKSESINYEKYYKLNYGSYES